MPLIYLEIERKAEYENYEGKKVEVPFKAIKSEWIREELCTECKSKMKKQKGSCSAESYLPINELCGKCRDALYFQRKDILRGMI